MVKTTYGTEILTLHSLLFCYFLSSTNCQLDITKNPKIIGGTEVTDRSQFPYQALLLRGALGRYTPFCGGAIIDEKHVLTAAHCIVLTRGTVSATSMLVVVGNLDSGDRSIPKRVQIVYPHEQFNPKNMQNDIALIKMLDDFGTWTRKVRPIQLKTDPTLRGVCIVSGFGITKIGDKEMSSKLMFVEVPIVDFDTCKKSYTTMDIGFNVICASAAEKDACTGDSGGPLICFGKLAGIVSFGPTKCGSEKYAGIYTDVAKYIQWIEEHKALVPRSSFDDVDDDDDVPPERDGVTFSFLPPDTSSSVQNETISLIVLLFIFGIVINM